MKRLWLLAAFLALLVMPAVAQQVPATANLKAQDTGACTTANACLSVNIPVNGASALIQLSGTWTATVQFEASTGSGPGGSPFTAITGTPVAGSGAVSSATANGAWRFNVSSVYVIRARVSSYGGGTVQAAITASTASTFSSTGFVPSGGGINGSGTANNYAMFTDPTDIGNAPTLVANGIIQNANPTSQPLVLFLCQNSASGTTNGLLVTRDSNGNCINLPASQTTNIVGVVYAGGGTAGTSMLCKIGSCPITLDNTSTVNDCIVASSGNAQGHDAGPTCPTGVQQLGIAQNVNAGPGTNATVDVFISNVAGGPNGSGQTIQVGGVTVAGTLDNFNNTTPAAQANFLNCFFQTDNGVPTSDISLECPLATTSQQGFVELAQDLGGASLAPIVQGIQTVPVTFSTPRANDVICFPTASTLGNCTLGVAIRTVSGNSDTILSTDRVSDVRYTAASGATAVALPQAGSAGFANNITMVLTNAQGSGTVTVTPTTSTINGSATLAIPVGNYCFIYSDNANYFANCGTSAGGSAGTVTSVGATVPGGFAISGSPVTTSGTLGITASAAGADYVLTTIAANTSLFEQVNGGSSCGDASHAVSYSISTHTFGCQSISGTGGSVTSVAQTVPSWLTVSGSPITTTGTLAITAATGQTSHQVIGTCGSATSFAPCALVAADVPPCTTCVTSVTGSGFLTSSGGTTPAISVAHSQGTDTNLLTSGTVSGTGASLCTDANGGATTSGCSGGSTPHPLVLSYGDPGNAVAIAAAATSTDYMTVPVGCTINAWNLLVDGGTITVKFWKIATGTAIPTSANSINTSGVSISSGTAIHSTTLTDFTTTTVSANDIVAMNVVTNSGAKFVSATLGCQ